MPTHKEKEHQNLNSHTKSKKGSPSTIMSQLKEKHYEMKTSDAMGRYIVATKHFKPGEIIISEKPLIVGPCTSTKVQCLGCYKVLRSEDYFPCKCGWPICSAHCFGLGKRYGHTTKECEILNKTKSSRLMDYNDFDDLSLHSHAIAPLRCLLLKEADPEAYNILMSMESHNSIRKDNPDIWEGNQTFIVDRIRKDWGLDRYPEDEIHTICGILEVNAFELGLKSISLRGVYPEAFLMPHDCVPNTNHIDEEDFTLIVRASTDISVGQHITLSYAYPLQSTIIRRKHILENKFFECQCRRCSDPTELGTFMGAMRCPRCRVGFIIQKQPLDSESEWTCNNQSEDSSQKCLGYTVPARTARLLVERITQEIESLDCNDIEGMELLLEKYKNVLHPTHFLCVKLKLSLSQLYGKIEGYIITELPDELLERKINICKELMDIFDKIEPGFTRIRGVTLYELHGPLMIAAKRAYEEDEITKDELRLKLQEISGYLNEVIEILGNEPKCSSEYMIASASEQALEKIKSWENILGGI